jgi:SLT domain-containing protein
LDGRPASSSGSAQPVAASLLSTPPTGGPAPLPQVNGWISQATKILEAQGIPASKLSPQDIWIIIKNESGGNPIAVNGWDSNAAAGTPSIGLTQTIAPTFNAYALPGHGDIYNPVDNIIAGVRYALARYGSLDNVPGVAAVHDGQPYVGY